MKVRLLSRELVADALWLADILIILGGSGLSFLVYINGVLRAGYLFDSYLTVTLIATAAYVGFGRLLEVYQPYKLADAFYGIGRAQAGFGLTLIACLAVGFSTHTTDNWSRGWALLWIALTVLGQALIRLSLSWAIIHWQRAGHWNDRIVVVGIPELASQVIHDLTEKGLHADTLAVFDERMQPRHDSLVESPRPLLFGLPTFSIS